MQGGTLPTTIGTGPDTVLPHMSVNTYLGDPQFAVQVDGHQPGGTQKAPAFHTARRMQAVTLQEAFAGSAHDLLISFPNDGYGGQTQHAVASLWSNGLAHVAPPVFPAESGRVSVILAADQRTP